MKIIAGIDGTGGGAVPGRDRDRQYDEDFANSFVRTLSWTPGTNTAYWRGPVTAGGGLVGAVNGAFSFIRNKVESTRGMREVLLTGYSRGAAGVVAVAKKLERVDIEVRAILLFDCVDRHVVIDAEIIPRNVRHVLHLVRDPKSKSRESFSNDAMYYYPPTQMEAYKFLCTHGGMGGVPWVVPDGANKYDLIDEGFPDGITTITYAEDKKVSERIWRFIQPFCRQHGFVQ